MERDEDKDSESEARSSRPEAKISKYILLFNDYYSNVFYVGFLLIQICYHVCSRNSVGRVLVL